MLGVTVGVAAAEVVVEVAEEITLLTSPVETGTLAVELVDPVVLLAEEVAKTEVAESVTDGTMVCGSIGRAGRDQRAMRAACESRQASRCLSARRRRMPLSLDRQHRRNTGAGCRCRSSRTHPLRALARLS